MEQFCRTEQLIGTEAQQKLAQSHVALFGLGGVGGFAAEALARAGVGKLTLVDFDRVEQSNLNRQLLALHSTVGMLKTDVAKNRIADINPQAQVEVLPIRFDENTAYMLDFSRFDYVVDAIDSVSSKVLLAQLCFEKGTPIVSCMGTGNKLDATAFCFEDIFSTSVCPLAKAMRKALKQANVPKLEVLFSKEQPQSAQQLSRTPSSISYVPAVAGLLLAGKVIQNLSQRQNRQ